MNRMWKIGSVEIENPFVLAPMAGVTDLPYRVLCREQGCGLVCMEMVSAKALCYQDKKSIPLLQLGDGEHPAAAQIFGSDAGCMAEAAQIAAEVSGAAVGAAVFSGVSASDGRPSSETTPITAPRSSAASTAQRTMRPARGRVLSAAPPEWSERFAIGLLSFSFFGKRDPRERVSFYKTEGEGKTFTPPRSCNNIPADRR